MKRTVLAVALAALLVAGAIFSELWYRGASRTMADMLDEVLRLVDSGDLEGADRAMDSLHLYLERQHDLMHMTGDHGEVDSLCEAAVRSRATLTARDMSDFAAETAEFERMIDHIFERERLSLANLF